MAKLLDGYTESQNQEYGVVSLKDLYGGYYRKMNPERRKLHDSGWNMLTSTLSKLDPTVYAPLTNITYGKDIKGIEVGNEMVENIEFYSEDYSGIANAINNIFASQADIVPRINAGLIQGNVPVYTFEIAYDLKFIELEKLAKKNLPVAIETVYERAVKTGYDLFVNTVAYEGFGDEGGLLNHSNVPVSIIPGVKKSTLATITDKQFVAMFNGFFQYFLSNSQYNINVLPDTVLVDEEVGREASSRISEMYTTNLRNFILANNLAIDEARANDLENHKIKIASRSQLNNKGIAGKGRVVVYKNDPMFVKLHIPFNFKTYYTGPNIDKFAYTTLWVGQVSQIQLPYSPNQETFGPIVYFDFEE